MRIHGDAQISMVYSAKEWLNYSAERTQRSFVMIREGSIMEGIGNLLLGRVQSAAAAVFVLASGGITLGISVLATPLFVAACGTLNLLSRLPIISRFENVQAFTKSSSDVIYRALRVNLIGIPAIFLFTSGAIVNTAIPVLRPNSRFFHNIHSLVSPLGKLETVECEVPGKISVTGFTSQPHFLQFGEEYVRALSYLNVRTKLVTNSVLYSGR